MNGFKVKGTHFIQATDKRVKVKASSPTGLSLKKEISQTEIQNPLSIITIECLICMTSHRQRG